MLCDSADGPGRSTFTGGTQSAFDSLVKPLPSQDARDRRALELEAANN